MMQKALFAASMIMGAALTGCGPRFDHLDFAQRTSPPLTATLSSTLVSIPAGIAVAFDPLPREDDGELIEKVEVDLVSSNIGVLGVDHDTEDGFVIYGVSEGSATISIFLDGEAVGTLPATVTKQ
ncbi:Hypothetical protein A7982_06728 [Minicystis rosea]|nr:Hypothetical protein A7982_06728 [Minicystis rosea]